MINLAEIAKLAHKNNASDIHIKSGNIPMMRIFGDLLIVPNANPVDSNDVSNLLSFLMNKTQQEIYAKQFEVDFATEINKFRFRINAYQTLNGPAIALRFIPHEIPTLEKISAPQILKQLAKHKSGLILLTGPAGSGKTTTLAALIEHINNNYTYNIITIEDPVEFIHTNKKSSISQREVGNNTKSFAAALKNTLRQDPDVILIGELRDLESIHLALTAAETGHLVLATLHTSSTAQTINRIIDVFPAADKDTVRSMLSGSLRAIIRQRLLKSTKGGRCAAHEILLANSSVQNLIRENKVEQIQSIIEINKKLGMNSLKNSILELLQCGLVSQEIANEAISQI